MSSVGYALITCFGGDEMIAALVYHQEYDEMDA